MHPKLATFISTVGGVGYARKAPGTFGSIAGLVLALPILWLGGPVLLLIASMIVFYFGWKAADVYEANTHQHDPSEIVIDEVVGQWIALGISLLVICWALYFMVGFYHFPFWGWYKTASDLGSFRALVPMYHWVPAIQWTLSFVFFRLFDIWKPSLIGRVDRNIGGGFGTMMDDVLAGLFAGILIVILEAGLFYGGLHLLAHKPHIPAAPTVMHG